MSSAEIINDCSCNILILSILIVYFRKRATGERKIIIGMLILSILGKFFI